MTEEEIMMFKNMCKVYWEITNQINDDFMFFKFGKNDIWRLYEKLEDLTGQPVTDWV